MNKLTAPIKRYGMAEWIHKHNISIYYLQETHFRCKKTQRKSRDGKRYRMPIETKRKLGQLHFYQKKKKKIDCKTSTTIKEGQSIMIQDP